VEEIGSLERGVAAGGGGAVRGWDKDYGRKAEAGGGGGRRGGKELGGKR
jgi:hypothetical protein